MLRLPSRSAVSPRARRRVHLFAGIAFGCVAAVSWWQVATEGATPARVIGAVFSTIVVVLEALFPPERKGLLRRRGRCAGAEEGSQSSSQEEEK